MPRWFRERHGAPVTAVMMLVAAVTAAGQIDAFSGFAAVLYFAALLLLLVAAPVAVQYQRRQQG
jgi:hypothetical protein